MMMVVRVVPYGGGLLLEVLLDGGVVGLSRGEIASLEILRQLGKGLSDGAGVGVGGRCGLNGLLREGRVGGQRGEVGLRLGKIAGLKVLAELLKLLRELRALGVLAVEALEEIAAGNS